MESLPSISHAHRDMVVLQAYMFEQGRCNLLGQSFYCTVQQVMERSSTDDSMDER